MTTAKWVVLIIAGSVAALFLFGAFMATKKDLGLARYLV